MFNDFLTRFHNCFDDLLYKLSICARDEFHFGGHQKRLKASDPISFVKTLLELQLLPQIGLNLAPKHLKYIYQRFFDRFPNLKNQITEQAVDGQSIFKEFYKRVFQTAYDSNWQIMLLDEHVSEFRPFLLENKMKSPGTQDAQALIHDLKKRFPREFGQRSTGKRSRMVETNVIELEPQELETFVFHEKKRERKSRRKFGGAQRDYEACFETI